MAGVQGLRLGFIGFRGLGIEGARGRPGSVEVDGCMLWVEQSSTISGALTTIDGALQKERAKVPASHISGL